MCHFRVQEMINKKREQREREEQEKELKREKERIQLGKEMSKLKNNKVHTFNTTINFMDYKTQLVCKDSATL